MTQIQIMIIFDDANVWCAPDVLDLDFTISSQM